MTKGIGVEQPRRYEVCQRQGGKAVLPVEITGLPGSENEALVLDSMRRVVARRKLTCSAGVASASFEIPEGGWYWIAVAAGRRRQRLAPFGVGDVFVIAGQSNAAGYGDGYLADRTGLVSIMTDSDDWSLATSPENLPGPLAAGCAWPVLGELLVLSQHVPIGFINTAVGGTTTEQWQPGGDLYNGLKRALTGRRVRAVLWHQGESDAASGFSTQRTLQNMLNIIYQSRADAGWQVPWYVAVASYISGVAQENLDAIRAAQITVHRYAFALPGPDTDTYIPAAMRYDTAHFGQVGLVVHGLLWFRAIHFARP